MMHDEYNQENDKEMKQARMLMILGVLKKYSDIENPLSQAEVGRLVEKEYGVKLYGESGTKTIKRHLFIIRDFLKNAKFGYTLEHSDRDKMVAHTYKDEATTLVEGVSTHGWYLDRDITNAELIPLIDGLLFSKYIPYSECKLLVEKLEDLSSIHFNRGIKLPVNEPPNKQLFYNVEMLSEAISKGKRVTFNMLDFGTDSYAKPRLYCRSDTPHLYEVSPYEIVITNGRYYLICSNRKGNNLCHYRVDYIKNIDFLRKDEDGDDVDSNYVPNRPMREMKGHENGLDLAKYMREHIYMYNGDSVHVEFIADKAANPSIVNQIRDWFGDGVTFSNEDANYVTARVTVNENAMLYWALQFGKCVKIIKPKELRDAVVEAIKGMLENYKN